MSTTFCVPVNTSPATIGRSYANDCSPCIVRVLSTPRSASTSNGWAASIATEKPNVGGAGTSAYPAAAATCRSRYNGSSSPIASAKVRIQRRSTATRKGGYSLPTRFCIIPAILAVRERVRYPKSATGAPGSCCRSRKRIAARCTVAVSRFGSGGPVTYPVESTVQSTLQPSSPRLPGLPAPRAAGSASPGAAPCTMTRVTNTDVSEQAASLRRWDQVYEQITPGRFIGTLHEVCFRSVQLFRETTSQAVHEAGGSWDGSRSFGLPLALSGAALFRGKPLLPGRVMTLCGSEELEFYAPRGFDLLGVSVDEEVLREHACHVEDRDIDRLLERRSFVVPTPERLARFRDTLSAMLDSLDANPTALRFEPTQRLLEETVLGAIVAMTDGDDPVSAPVSN